MVAVELQHVFEGEITDDVRVEDEERLVVDVQQLSSQSQGARCTQTSVCSFLIFINSIKVSQKYKHYTGLVNDNTGNTEFMHQFDYLSDI